MAGSGLSYALCTAPSVGASGAIFGLVSIMCCVFLVYTDEPNLATHQIYEIASCVNSSGIAFLSMCNVCSFYSSFMNKYKNQSSLITCMNAKDS